MPYVTSDMTAAMRTNVRAIFLQALGELATQFNSWEKIASRIPSEHDKEEYDWLGATPPMSEWKDTRKTRGLRPYSYTLTNQHWESTLEINRDAFNDNKLGHIPMRVKGLARSYLKRILQDVFSQLDSGAAAYGYDTPYYFFSDTRVIGDSANIDNLLSGAYSGSSAEIRAAIQLAVSNMMNFQDDWGNPLGLMPDTIVCSPKMYIPIREALKADVAGNQRAEGEFIKNIIASPWIDLDTDDYYILCTTEEIKPIIFQERQKPEITSLDKPDSHDAFMKNTLYYGIDARHTVGFGDPRTAIKIVDV